MKVSNLTSIKNKKPAKRVGRGEASGKGKTAGRGMKGQKSRGKIKAEFEGGQLPIIKRLPFQKGVGNKSLKKKATVTLNQLDKFNSKEVVDSKTVQRLMPVSKQALVKVVATGQLTKPLTVKLPTTSKAKKAIEAAKGKVEPSV